MKILFLIFTSLFCYKSNFRKIFFTTLNDTFELKDLNNNTKISNNTNVKEGYDERHVRNETKEREDINKIKNFFVKISLIKILEKKHLSNVHKVDVLKKYEKIINEPEDIGNNFYRDILNYEFLLTNTYFFI